MLTPRPARTGGPALVLTAALLVFLTSSPLLAGQPSNVADPLPLADAEARLAAAATLLGDPDADVGGVKKALEELGTAHAQAGGSEREQGVFRHKAEALLLKALTIFRTERGKRDVNVLDDVNGLAASLLGRTAAVLDARQARALSVRIRTAIQDDIEKGRKPEQWNGDHLQAAFAALAALNDHGTLAWVLDRYHHSKEREIPMLIAAHRALVGFHEVPGKLRHAICDTLITAYAGVESAAERSSNSPSDVAAKRIWDRLRLHTIPVLQHYAGQPKNAKGEALSTVAEFRVWWKDHRSLRKAPWKD